jgi:hypothetical protein
MLLVNPAHAQPGNLQTQAAAHINADGAFRYVCGRGKGGREGKISRRERWKESVYRIGKSSHTESEVQSE